MSSTTRVSLLLQLRSKQNSDAWSKFVQLYTPLICRWVSDLGVVAPERNDVVQDVFVALLGKISTFQYDANQSFRAWLRTVTINKTRDQQRKKNRLSEPNFLATIEVAAKDDSDLLTRQEYRDYVADAAFKLMRKHFSETTWRACWQHVGKGKSAREVAAELGISVNAVYLARGRVLKRLKQELDGLWD